MPCKGVKCPDGYECQNGVGTACCVVKCEKGQTDCPMCAADQIYDGTRCRYPCEGVTCPLGKQCENGKGKACCVTVAGVTPITDGRIPCVENPNCGKTLANGIIGYCKCIKTDYKANGL